MGRVDAFQLPGVDCWFYSQDHRPPHFHARRRGQWHARVFFLEPAARMIEPVRRQADRMSASDRARLAEAAAAGRRQLLAEWENKVACDE